MLACEIPTSRSPESRRGTRAGAAAHRRAGEPVCGDCKEAERVRDSQREGRGKKRQQANLMSFLSDLAEDTKSQMTGAEPPKGWRKEAACRDKPTSWFFGSGDELRKGADVCRQCPVRVECATEHQDEDLGMWGGIARLVTHACATPSSAYPDGRTGSIAGVNVHTRAGESCCSSCLSAQRDERSLA